VISTNREEARDVAFHVKTLQNSWLEILSKFYALVLRKPFFAFNWMTAKVELQSCGKKRVVIFELVMSRQQNYLIGEFYR
jgi:hypothetical protein